MNSNRQAVAGKDGYFELSETIKAFVDHTCLWNFLYDLVYADGAERCKNTRFRFARILLFHMYSGTFS